MLWCCSIKKTSHKLLFPKAENLQRFISPNCDATQLLNLNSQCWSKTPKVIFFIILLLFGTKTLTMSFPEKTSALFLLFKQLTVTVALDKIAKQEVWSSLTAVSPVIKRSDILFPTNSQYWSRTSTSNVEDQIFMDFVECAGISQGTRQVLHTCTISVHKRVLSVCTHAVWYTLYWTDPLKKVSTPDD